MKAITTEMKQKGLSLQVDREQLAMSLKTWRLRSGLTQNEVASRWGISRFTVIRIEKGREVSWEIAYRTFAKLSEELRAEGQ